MGKPPKPPGRRSPQPKPAYFHDRGEATDRREIAVMAVLKAPRCRMPLECRLNHLCDMLPLLLCGGSKPRDTGTCPPDRGGCVADREDAWAATHRKIVIDDDTAGFISGLSEPLRSR